jgi:FkbM family methyltransferase
MQTHAKRPVAFVLTATNHGSMLVNRNDFHTTSNGGYGVGYQLFKNSSFDPFEIDFVLQLLEIRKSQYGEGVVAIDCGANIGAHTIEWAKLMYGWGEVLAIEAQERIFYALAGNITMNNCFNARAIWAAVGAENGEIGVPVPDYLLPSSFGSLEIRQRASNEFIGQAIDYDKPQPTRLMTIDSLGLARLDFIKIDIEGMEVEALLGAQETIVRCLPSLLIEKIKSDESRLSEMLTAWGYKLFPLGLNILAVHATDPVANEIRV